MHKTGLFVGLTTLDVMYQVEQLPAPNQKIVALDYCVAAGGPATNAAVTFAALGDRSTVLSVLGCHPMTSLIHNDLRQQQVNVADLLPAHTDPPPTSSILVTQATGERAVVSLNAVNAQATVADIPPHCLDGIAIVLIDGHQMQVSVAIAQQARASGIPVVIDGGSWKPGFEQVLPLADYVICSANFHPPGCITPADTIAYLQRLGVPYVAMTRGGEPIQVSDRNRLIEIPVSPIHPIDTTGAGDALHGAFCHFVLRQPFISALAEAAAIASRSCLSFGSRRWLDDLSAPIRKTP